MSLGSQDLAAMRAAQETLMPDTCVIQRATYGRNTIGEGTATWAAAGTTVCRLRPPGLQPDIRNVGEQVQTLSRWVATLPHDQIIYTGDRLVISSTTFEVVHVWDVETWATAMRCELQKLEA